MTGPIFCQAICNCQPEAGGFTYDPPTTIDPFTVFSTFDIGQQRNSNDTAGKNTPQN